LASLIVMLTAVATYEALSNPRSFLRRGQGLALSHSTYYATGRSHQTDRCGRFSAPSKGKTDGRDPSPVLTVEAAQL
jgi:hypothetical protein